MAYVSQDLKKTLAVNVKAICKKFNVKGSLSVRNHSTLVLNVRSGAIDFIDSFNKTCGSKHYYTEHGWTPAKDHISINPYHYEDHFSGKALAFLKEVMIAMNRGNHDNSDIQTDYFDVGWYVDINIGRWNQPYVVTQ